MNKQTSIAAYLSTLGLFVLWQVGAMGLNAPYILPTPLQILQKMWELRVPLFGVHLLSTFSCMAIGLLISVVFGVLLAIVMDASALCKQAMYPLVIGSQTIPITALAPLFVLWFGYTIWSRVLVTVLITFFPITVSVYDGFQWVKSDMLDLMHTFGASRWQVFYKLKIPAALPSFFSAMKMAIPLSVIGAAIGEWLGAQSGLGYFSRRMMTQLDGAGVFAPIVLLSVLALVLVWMLNGIECRWLTWSQDGT